MTLLKKKSSKTKEEAHINTRILHFLHGHKTGVLATVDPDGNPQASAVYYAHDSAFKLRFLTKRRTKKSDGLAKNNRAVFVVFDEKDQVTVKITGYVTEITSPEEAHAVFRNALRASLRTGDSAVPPISKLEAGEYVSYLLTPTEVKMAVYAKPGTGSHDMLFESADLQT